MNKKELTQDLAKKFDLPFSKTNDIVTSMLESITKSLTKGDAVTFVGFGSFAVKLRGARKGRNPQTGDAIEIPARKTIKFTAGKGLKDSVNKK